MGVCPIKAHKKGNMNTRYFVHFNQNIISYSMYDKKIDKIQKKKNRLGHSIASWKM